MAVRVVNIEPDPGVLRQIVCQQCGVTLEYVPIDIKRDGNQNRYIECPNCNRHQYLDKD